MKRQANAKAEFDKVSARAEETKTAYEPFMQGLRDIRTALSNDLTPAGVRTARPTIDRTLKSGVTVRTKLGALTAEIDGLSQRWSSAPK